MTYSWVNGSRPDGISRGVGRRGCKSGRYFQHLHTIDRHALMSVASFFKVGATCGKKRDMHAQHCPATNSFLYAPASEFCSKNRVTLHSSLAGRFDVWPRRSRAGNPCRITLGQSEAGLTAKACVSGAIMAALV